MNCFMTLEQSEKSFMNDEQGRTWNKMGMASGALHLGKD
jgi:hypothetical protein